MFKLIALAPIFGIPPLLSATDAPLDLGSLLTAYGTAAPFAALCLWQLQNVKKERDELRDENKTLHAAAVQRERELIGSVAPMFYDAARLYEGANRKLTQAPPAPTPVVPVSDVETLARGVQELIARLDERR